MTMQRGDYQRVADTLRKTRDRSLTDSDSPDDIRDTYVDLAMNLAASFVAVNDRFKVDKFLLDALGDEEGKLAIDEYNNERKDREPRNRRPHGEQ